MIDLTSLKHSTLSLDEVLCRVEIVFWVIVWSRDEIPPNQIGCISLSIYRQNVSVDFRFHSAAIVMSYIINKD